MPTGPKGQKRSADVIGNAVKVMKIATGEEEEEFEAKPEKDEAAAALGRKGGKARAKAMTPQRRSEVARKAAPWSAETVFHVLALLSCTGESCCPVVAPLPS
jgi:hypothetical protein